MNSIEEDMIIEGSTVFSNTLLFDHKGGQGGLN
jgi:hypothetical protein